MFKFLHDASDPYSLGVDVIDMACVPSISFDRRCDRRHHILLRVTRQASRFSRSPRDGCLHNYSLLSSHVDYRLLCSCTRRRMKLQRRRTQECVIRRKSHLGSPLGPARRVEVLVSSVKFLQLQFVSDPG